MSRFVPSRALVALAVIGVLACGHFERRRATANTDEQLAQIDALLRERHDPERLDEALLALDTLMLDMGDDPRLLARLSMAQHAQAYAVAAEGGEPVRLFEAGRETAWRCLYQEPAFEGVLSAAGGHIGPAAAQRIDEAHGRCLLWLVANWTRWLALRDPAGFAIDLEPLRVLADRAVELNSGPRRAQALGLAGVSRALAPAAMNPDLGEARALLLRGVEQDPTNLSLLVDLVEYVYGPLEDRVSQREILDRVLAADPREGGRWQHENLQAQLRARALAEALDER